MTWKPLSSVAFAICTFPFVATEPNDLPLQVGDHIYIIEQGGQTNAWYRGYLVAPPSLLAGLTSDRGQQLEHRVFSGIFPVNCVEVREYLGEQPGSKWESAPNGTLENGFVGAKEEEEDDDDDTSARRKSRTTTQARKLNRRLSRKRSMKDMNNKTGSSTTPDEPMPRDPEAPKPLAPVPLLRVGDEVGLSAAEPLVDEIASCLREWHDARLHEMLLQRGYSQLAQMQELIVRVDNSRKQLMHDVLTAKELTVLREETVWDLVAGNKLLGDEIIVRSSTEKGRLLTADDSVIEMTRLQANMSILDRAPNPTPDKHMLHHLLVDVRNLVCESDQLATLQMCLCSKAYGERLESLSENYAISVPIPAEPPQTPRDRTKTLFVNLTNADVGVGFDNRSLYLVFKLLRDEPVRSTTHGQNASLQPKASLHSAAGAERSGLKGRRSMFGSQRRREAHGRNPSDMSNRPDTSQSQRSQRSDTDGQSSIPAPEPAVAGETKTVRRTIGVGAIEITQLVQSTAQAEKSIALWSPSTAVDERIEEDSDWEEAIRDMLRSNTGGYSRTGHVKRLDVFVKPFATADLPNLVGNTPTLLHDVHMTPKIGFSGVPAEKRSDIYLTLTQPHIPQNSSLAHAKHGAVPLSQRCQTNMANLQLTLEVRKANGERIDDCIFTAANHQGHTAWRTVGIERGESWNQTIRLAIPADEVPGSHIVMSIADSPNFPFALAWVPLWEDAAFVRDGDHHVALYVYDEYSSSIIGGRGAYLALPPWHDKGDTTQQNGATISLRTFLCSTEYSQDPTLLGILNWRNYHGEQLVELLERFSYIPEMEIVKMLSEVFKALFEILHEYESIETYEDVIFNNFVVILSIARDKRFELGSIIEDYATTRHEWPNASQHLVRAYQRLTSNPLDPESARRLRTTFKVGDQMLKLIVETTRNEDGADNSSAQVNGSTSLDPKSRLRRELQTLFVAIMALLRNPLPVLLGTQTLLVQHFHTWLPELVSLMTPPQILEVATDLLDSCAHAQGKMIFYRLILMVNYSHLEVFKSGETRTTLVANTFRWLAPYWGYVDDATDQWRDQVRLCCSVVAAQMEHLGEESCQYVPMLAESFAALQKRPRIAKRTFSMLFPSTYPFPAKPTTQRVDVEEAMLEISALLAAALTSERRLYFDRSQVDIAGVLLEALKVGQSILTCEAFPASWLSLLVSHHRYGITALERISEVLVESLPDMYAADGNEVLEFDTAIWRAFFDTLFVALSSPALAMETFPEQKRRAIWKIAGDVRELGANLLKRSWDAIGWDTDDDTKRLHGFDKMGGYQVQFVPDLVAPVVELCLSVHATLRGVAIEVLRSMIISAWQIDQDLSIIQNAMIDCLDKLCRTKNVTESVLRKMFVPEMLEHFKHLQRSIEDSLYAAVVEMFGKIDDLLVMLASVHSPGTASNDASRLVDTLRLMEFLKDVQSEEAYIRYVHQLADMQIAAGNITEAGLALQMHADRYEWDPTATLPALEEPALPTQTAFERKEALFFQMCKHFETGRSWRRALAAYRELALQYELNVFDFSKLARAQRAIAGIQERIAGGDRANPRYFRVVYRGLGFPDGLRDKQFIFEGLASDRLAVFEERMQQLHPSAKMLRGSGAPDVEGQYLQIYAVGPNKDIQHMVYQRTKVSPSVKEYNLISNPRKFSTATRQPVRDVSVTEQVVEKTIYTTAEEFPTILRRSEIIGIETIALLPIEAAIERTTRKTQELLAQEKRVTGGEDEEALARMTEDLLASVDPNSESSVARYRTLLPASEVGDNASVELAPSLFGKDQPLDSMQNALKVALLDHALAIRRCLGLFRKPPHLATRAELVPRFEAAFGHELSTLFPGKAALVDDPTPRPSLDEPAYPTADQQQAVNGAQHADPEAERQPRQRRSSLTFLKRSTSRQGRPQEAADGGGGRDSRTGSRTRERSTSRFSFLRRSQKDLQTNQEGDAGGVKKRLSFFKNDSASRLADGTT